MTSARSSVTTSADAPSKADDAPSKDEAPKISLSAAAREWLALYRLARLYENRSTRHQFRDAAKEAGFDVGKADERDARMDEVGELEAALADLQDEAPKISLSAAREWLAIYRLARLYENRSTRHQFRDAAKEDGFDVGKADERDARMWEVGPLEAALADLPPSGRA